MDTDANSIMREFIRKLKEELRAEMEETLETERQKIAVQQMADEEETLLYEDLRPDIYDALRQKMEAEVAAQVREDIRNQLIEDWVIDQVREKVEEDIRSEMIEASVIQQIRNRVENDIRTERIAQEVIARLREELRPSIEAQLRQETRAELFDALRTNEA